MRRIARAHPSGVLNASNPLPLERRPPRRSRRSPCRPTSARDAVGARCCSHSRTPVGSSRPSSGSCSTGSCSAPPSPACWSSMRCGSRYSPSLVAALWIARLFVIGHDACHGSYTPNKTLNKWIGRIAFLPSLTPYSLWEIGHNLAHHGFTNLKGRDYVWTPFSPQRIRAPVLGTPQARTRLPQRRRTGRVLHGRDVVEEAFFPGPQACRHASAPAKAPTSIIPSKPMLITPDRSQKTPPIAAKISGVEDLKVAPITAEIIALLLKTLIGRKDTRKPLKLQKLAQSARRHASRAPILNLNLRIPCE